MDNNVRENILKAVRQYDMLSQGDKVIAAVSGGADSVTLLHGLKALEEELGITVYACHVNHNLRGAESDADESYVRELCKGMGVELEVFSVDVKGSQSKHESTEETARALRYQAFSQMAERLGAKVATAHNACDNAETVLLNMLRGTGLKGLCGIPPVRDYLIRPLIFCEREEIEEYCRLNGLKFAVDKTNFSTAYTRNKIRLELMPQLLKINPSFYSGIGRMTSSLIQDSIFLEEQAKAALDNARTGDGVYSAKMLKELPEPIFDRAISMILREKDVEPSALRINGFAEIIRAGTGKINLEKNKFAVVKKDMAEVQFITQKYRKKIS